LRFLPEVRIPSSDPRARFASRQERRLTAPRYEIGPPIPERPRHGSVPKPPSPLPEAGPCTVAGLAHLASEAEGGAMLWFWLALFRSWETAVTSWAGANGFCSRMLSGTPCDAQSFAVAPVM
jgi:hypothetical protein